VWKQFDQMSNMDWQIILTAEQLRAISTDPRLPPLLGLCRVTNALSLGYTALMAPLEYQSPRSRRDRFSAFMYTGAMLAEGMVFARALGKHFRHLQQYRDGFATLLGDKSLQEFRRRFLKPLRDKLTFHFDLDVVPAALARMEFSEFVIATGRGRIAGQIYFDLADEIVTAHLVGPQNDEARFLEVLDEFMSGTSALYRRFMQASHSLIAPAWGELGARRRSLRPKNAES
jgi:hypothetical protein